MKKLLKSVLFIFFLTNLQAQDYNFSPVKDLPGAPENAPCLVKSGKDNLSISLIYNGGKICKSVFSNPVTISSEVKGAETVEQVITLSFLKKTAVNIVVYGSKEAIAAETKGKAQEKFPLVRTTHGLSNNLRNNAIYDRRFDWMLEFPEGTVIKPFKNIDGTTRFEITMTTNLSTIIFRPRYYQKHKNLPNFQPWTYRVYKETVTGWSSWWAYFREFKEKDLDDLLKVWEMKHFDDYGYRFIQIDDVYQGENDKGRENCKVANGYLGGRPTTWLDWKKDLFPGGLSGFVKSVRKAGFNPAVWMGCFFSDEATVKEHPGWFVTDNSGKPAAAPWVSYAVDASNGEAANALIRPTFRGLKDAGVDYVKIDQLRHYLYDNLHNNLDWCKKRGIRPDELLRTYMGIAREELGDDTFILSCWGVLPQNIGLVDACRIGGDGYGPVTMQQYNSWNGIVWRNDPDHCDVLPNKVANETGNVKNTKKSEAAYKESIIRPALASIAGTMLMLSDKPDVYKNDKNLYGLRRSSPVVFTVPGQLYDYDPVKTDNIKNMDIMDIKSGKRPSPIDADQFGDVCPYWLNEFNFPFENWYVFHRLNWDAKKSLKKEKVTFSDLGIDPSKEYLVYEFWKNKFIGVLKGELYLDKLEGHGLESFAIREKLDHPQLISTNRHLSQGAVEIEKLFWDNNSIDGRSRVIVDDEYVITLFVPDNYKFVRALINGKKAETKINGNILKIYYLPKQTASVSWKVEFAK